MKSSYHLITLYNAFTVIITVLKVLLPEAYAKEYDLSTKVLNRLSSNSCKV